MVSIINKYDYYTLICKYNPIFVYNTKMIIFRVFQIRKYIREAKENPSALAGNEVGDTLWGIVLVPLVIGIIGIILFFIIGYTNLFGFHLGFFKFLFWLSLIIGLIVFSVIRSLIKSVSRSTTIHTKSIIKTLDLENNNDKFI